MNSSIPPGAADEQLEKGALSTTDIVFFVLAGVAPMGVVVAVLSLSVALGNGPGVPGTYLIAGVVLALFAAGYVQMSRRITNTGGFYTYAREGLGKAAGGAAACLALVTYNAGTIGIFGSLAYFSDVVAGQFGLHLGWATWAVVALAAVAALSYFEVTLSAKALAVLLAAEVLVLLAFDVAVLVHNGFHGFSLSVFRPSVVFGGGFGISLMLAFGSFAGFEATALYGEEAKNPRRSVPRATYLALAAITIFYLLTMWAAITSYGFSNAKAAAQADPQNFMFKAMASMLSQGMADVMAVLVVTSLFAAFLAFHCNTARYQFALARAGLLPHWLTRTHPRYGSPVAASALQLLLVAVVTAAFGLAGKDPYLGMGVSLFGFGVLGIVVLQAIAAASIVGFFLRRREGEPVLLAIVAPVLGGLGLVVGLVYMISNYSVLAAGTVKQLDYLPWLLPIAAVLGAVAAVTRHRNESVRRDQNDAIAGA
ncbi:MULTISPECIES: APC family permease [Amycolatopsis]|uniref:APC family permease n=1 Tax=Amycolatopsis albidoflavus TaxID=102226 RepID=A0ABW5IBE5_9PSEU